MEQQTRINLEPDSMEAAVRVMCNGEFYRRRDEDENPTIKNRYEAFGIMSECYQKVSSAVKDVKDKMSLQGTMLPIGDGSYTEIVDQTHNACMKAMAALAMMAVNATNIVYGQMNAVPDATPLEELADADDDLELLTGDEEENGDEK